MGFLVPLRWGGAGPSVGSAILKVIASSGLLRGLGTSSPVSMVPSNVFVSTDFSRFSGTSSPVLFAIPSFKVVLLRRPGVGSFLPILVGRLPTR